MVSSSSILRRLTYSLTDVPIQMLLQEPMVDANVVAASASSKITRDYRYARRHGLIRPCCSVPLHPVVVSPQSFASHPNTRSRRIGHSLPDIPLTRPFRVVYRFGTHFTGRSIHHHNNDDEVLASHTPLLVARGGVLVLRLPTDVSFIDLNGSKHEAVFAIDKDRTGAMSQVPGGFLTDAEVTCQLRICNIFQAGLHQILGGDPDPTTQR